MSLSVAHIDTERSWRGGQQQVVTLIKGLSRRGIKNTLFCRRNSKISRVLTPSEARTVSLPFLGEWDLYSTHVMNRFLKKEKIDIVHAHTGHAVTLGVLGALGTGIPAVATRRIDLPIGKNPLSSWSYKRLAAVAAISKGVKDSLHKSGIDKQKIHLIPSAYDKDRISAVRPYSKSDFCFSSQMRVVGLVGALSTQKDPLTFLQIVHDLREGGLNVGGVLVGEGALRSVLEERIRQLNLESFVRLVGFRPDALSYIAGFDVFCLPSIHEGLGSVLLETMALGVPVVASRIPGIVDLVEEGTTGFFGQPGVAASFSTAIKKVLSMPIEDRNLLIQNAKEKAARFEAVHMVDSYAALYNQLHEQRVS